jgi:hypothetical protein
MKLLASDNVRTTLHWLLPILVPIAILVVGFLWFIQPVMTSAQRSRTDSGSLQERVTQLENVVRKGGGVRPPAADEELRTFERLVPLENRVPDLVELVARLALDPPNPDEARGLVVEAGPRTPVVVGSGSPQAAGGANEPGVDPRLALFPPALEATPITVTFDATYDRLGIFLWRLRDLPTFTEVRSLEITRGLPLIKVKLVLFAFQRVTAAGRPEQPASAPVQPAGPKVARTSTSDAPASRAVGLP